MVGGRNWEEAYARLEQIRLVIESGGTRSPEEARRILRARAKALAKPLTEPRIQAEAEELLVFTLAGERYGIEVSQIEAVTPLLGLTPVPGAPPFVLGVMNHRGRILTVLDLREIMGLPQPGNQKDSWVVVGKGKDALFGLSSDSSGEIGWVESDEIVSRPSFGNGGARAFVRGLTRDMVAVLDLEALAADPQFLVNDEGA